MTKTTFLARMIPINKFIVDFACTQKVLLLYNPKQIKSETL